MNQKAAAKMFDFLASCVLLILVLFPAHLKQNETFPIVCDVIFSM